MWNWNKEIESVLKMEGIPLIEPMWNWNRYVFYVIQINKDL